MKASRAQAMPIPRPASSAPDGGSRLHELFIALSTTAPHTPRWQELRDELVRLNMPLVYYLVRRFSNSSESIEDLRQVATIGLIKAIDKFDVHRGVEFSSYATPTILGELKRHLRDKGWALRVPRRIQEHVLTIGKTTNDLTAQLNRSPTVPELAEATGMSEEEVLEALESQHSYAAISLEDSNSADTDFLTNEQATQQAEIALERVENRAWLKELLRRLNPRERQIVLMRFFANMTQSEIAKSIGVSQMHISRLLSRSLVKLRETGEH